jgi:uridine kinase
MDKRQSAETAERTGSSFVIAVSGTSGAGKSSVVANTAVLLTSAARLHFDDYVTLGNDIAQIRAWIDAGANPDEIKTPVLALDLRALISGEPIRPPNAGHMVQPADYILLEEPFGRSRLELASLIDLTVHIDVPPDVALARRIIREIAAQQNGAEQLVGEIEGQLRAFLAIGRDAYLAAARAARQSADIVLDGMLPVDELAATIVEEVRRRA